MGARCNMCVRDQVEGQKGPQSRVRVSAVLLWHGWEEKWSRSGPEGWDWKECGRGVRQGDVSEGRHTRSDAEGLLLPKTWKTNRKVKQQWKSGAGSNVFFPLTMCWLMGEPALPISLLLSASVHLGDDKHILAEYGSAVHYELKQPLNYNQNIKMLKFCPVEQNSHDSPEVRHAHTQTSHPASISVTNIYSITLFLLYSIHCHNYQLRYIPHLSATHTDTQNALKSCNAFVLPLQVFFILFWVFSFFLSLHACLHLFFLKSQHLPNAFSRLVLLWVCFCTESAVVHQTHPWKICLWLLSPSLPCSLIGSLTEMTSACFITASLSLPPPLWAIPLVP